MFCLLLIAIGCYELGTRQRAAPSPTAGILTLLLIPLGRLAVQARVRQGRREVLQDSEPELRAMFRSEFGREPTPREFAELAAGLPDFGGRLYAAARPFGYVATAALLMSAAGFASGYRGLLSIAGGAVVLAAILYMHRSDTAEHESRAERERSLPGI